MLVWCQGRIAWSRQLLQRIEEPMEAFQKHAKILRTSEGKKAIRLYNSLAKTLIEYELLYLEQYKKQVGQIRLQSSI